MRCVHCANKEEGDFREPTTQSYKHKLSYNRYPVPCASRKSRLNIRSTRLYLLYSVMKVTIGRERQQIFSLCLLEGVGDFYRVILAMTRGFEGPPYSQAPDLGVGCMLNTEYIMGLWWHFTFLIPLVIHNLFVREKNVVLPFSDCLKQKDRYQLKRWTWHVHLYLLSQETFCPCKSHLYPNRASNLEQKKKKELLKLSKRTNKNKNYLF